MSKFMKIISRGAVGATKCAIVIIDHALYADILCCEHKPKVSTVGFNNMGSTSLHVTFLDLRYRSSHWKVWCRADAALVHRCFSALRDGITEDFTLLDQNLANSKSILQGRDLDKWISSKIEHILRYPTAKWMAVSSD